MPRRPPKACSRYGCPGTTRTGGLCDQCKGTKPKHGEPRATRPIDRHRWKVYSKHYLKGNPVCVKCGHPSRAVDHIKPTSNEDDPAFWNPQNHQALCWSCHSRKTVEHDGGFGRRMVRSGGGGKSLHLNHATPPLKGTYFLSGFDQGGGERNG